MTNRFQKGSGNFKCECCGRNTRMTGTQSVGSRLCPDCYELAGIYNELQDDGEDAIRELETTIKHHCSNILKNGGTLDGDACELLGICEVTIAELIAQ